MKRYFPSEKFLSLLLYNGNKLWDLIKRASPTIPLFMCYLLNPFAKSFMTETLICKTYKGEHIPCTGKRRTLQYSGAFPIHLILYNTGANFIHYIFIFNPSFVLVKGVQCKATRRASSESKICDLIYLLNLVKLPFLRP